MKAEFEVAPGFMWCETPWGERFARAIESVPVENDWALASRAHRPIAAPVLYAGEVVCWRAGSSIPIIYCDERGALAAPE